MRQRHTKYDDTPYALEPNCKESPGGLRDLQILLWVARAAGLGRSWAELGAKGLVTPFEVKQLQRNEGVLKMIRARLHIVAGRREDRLVFDLQTAVAESFGFTPLKGQRVSEQLMRRYYWAAKAVVQLNQILLLNIEEHIARRGRAADAQAQRALLRPRRHDRSGQRRPLPARTARDSRNLPRLHAGRRRQGAVGTHAARAVQRAPRDECEVPQRPGQPRALHRDPAPARGPDACAAADEPDLGARPLPVGVPPHRRPDAARPVPRLHGRSAHPDGGAQHAPLLHRRACARVPVLLAARRRFRAALRALRGRAVPRRGQGPRRRPLAARRQRGAALLPRPRASPPRTPS